MITRDEVLQFLKEMKPGIVERYGLISLGLFGSVARGESRPDSDVDVVVRLREPNLFYLVISRRPSKKPFTNMWTSFTTVKK